MRRIEHRGAVETAHRALQNCGQVFRYAIATGRAERDPAAGLRGAIPLAKDKHHASITDPMAIGDLLRTIDGYQARLSPSARCGWRHWCSCVLANCARPNGSNSISRRPNDATAARMKMRAPHIIPLSAQALAVLRELQPLAGRGRYLFPGAPTNGRPMSENTVNAFR